MNKEYYSEYYNLERSNWWFLARRNILSAQIKKLPISNKSLRILNLGIATGASSQWLSEFGNVTSVEYDKDVCDFVREELKIDVVQASITDLPFEDKSFDLVCAFDVIEHVEDDRKAIEEMSRVCTKQGYIFVTVPAFMHLWSEHDEINLHFRRYTMDGLTNLIKKEVLSIKYNSYFNTFLYPPISLVRVISMLKSNKKEKQPKSDFSKINSSFLEKILFHIFNSENILLRRSIKMPFGVSIMLLAQVK